MNIYKYVNRGSNPVSIDNITIAPYGEYISTTTVPALDRLDGILVDRYINQEARFDPKEFNYYRPTISHEKGDGLQLNGEDPRFGWHDLLSAITIDRDAASNKPTFTVFRAPIKKYQFKIGDESFHNFHLPHDYLPNSDIFIHVHWATNATNLLGNTVWQFDATYAKGYSQDYYEPSVTVQVTGNAVTTNPYMHYISEVQLTGPGLIDKATLETDGLLLVRTSLVSHTLGVDPFMMFCDVHYQSTGIPTINRNYNFWQ